MVSQLIAAAASVALVGASAAGIADVRSSDATLSARSVAADSDAGGSPAACRVDVIRTGQAGTINSTRSFLRDNSCVCTIVTGPADSNGDAENTVNSMIRERSCADSPTVGNQVSQAARAGGGHTIIPIVVAVVGAAGLAVALGSNGRSNDSRG